jgi:SAM-dependent methyltransferase
MPRTGQSEWVDHPSKRLSAVPCDYDLDPRRSRTKPRARRLTPDQPEDVHEPVARRLAEGGVQVVLDVGCGTGRLRDFLPPSLTWIGADRSPAQLGEAPRPVLLADASHLPLRSDSVDAVTALWMLYHLTDPVVAIAEAHRVLKVGGMFVACTRGRDDSPEVMPPRPPTPFDAEDAPGIVTD